MRKPIQIAVAFDAGDAGGGMNTSSYRPEPFTIALCDDGTIWQRWSSQDSWERLPDIPQGISPRGTNA